MSRLSASTPVNFEGFDDDENDLPDEDLFSDFPVKVFRLSY